VGVAVSLTLAERAAWSIEMTLRYNHLSPEVKREAVALLDGTSSHRNGNLTATEPVR
jgi:hypothetical protein